MARPRPVVRLFVAVYPPPEAAREMLDTLRELDLPPHRITPVGQAHITVQFIGDTPLTRLPGAIESVERAAAGLEATRLTPHELISLPERGPARLLAVETDAPAVLRELHRRLVVRFARNVRPRERAYRPHITVCRFRAPSRDVRVTRALSLPSFRVDGVHLMKSTLRPGGAEHEEVAQFPLAEG